MLKGTPIETGYYKILETRIVPKLIDWRLTPNHITYGGLLISMLAGLSFIYFPLLGGVFTLLTGLLDTLDGSLARATGQSKKFGAFLDSVLDRYTELIIYLGIWFYFYRNNAQTPYSAAHPAHSFRLAHGQLHEGSSRRAGRKMPGGSIPERREDHTAGSRRDPQPVHKLARRWFRHPWAMDLALKGVLVVLAFGTNLTAMWRFLHVLNKLRKKI